MDKRGGESSKRGHRPSASIVGSDRRNWKLVIDPMLKKGYPHKLYRFDGAVPQSESSYNVTYLSDPRTRTPRFRARSESADLPIPSFKIDSNYVGQAPEREVSFFDLNDNINQAFLRDLCGKCGEIDEAKIYYHPKTKRHLGLGRALFKKAKAARICVERFNNTSVMGKTILVILDLFGHEVKRMAEEKSNDNSPVVPPHNTSSTSTANPQGFSPFLPKAAPTPASRPAPVRAPEPAAVSPQVPEDPMVRELPPPPPPPPPAPPFPPHPPAPSSSDPLISWLVTPPPQPPVVWSSTAPPLPPWGASGELPQQPYLPAGIPLPPERPMEDEVTFRKHSKRSKRRRNSSGSSHSSSRSPSMRSSRKYHRSEHHRHRDSSHRNRDEGPESSFGRNRSISSGRERSGARSRSNRPADKSEMEAISSDESDRDGTRESRETRRRHDDRKRRSRRTYSSSSSRDTYSSGESSKAFSRNRKRDSRKSRWSRDHGSRPSSREHPSRPRSRDIPQPRPKSRETSSKPRDFPAEKKSAIAAQEISEKLKSLEPSASDPTGGDSSPLSLESRIQSILRGAEKEVLKAVTEEDKAKKKTPKKEPPTLKKEPEPVRSSSYTSPAKNHRPPKHHQSPPVAVSPLRHCAPIGVRPPGAHMWAAGRGKPGYGWPHPPHLRMPVVLPPMHMVPNRPCYPPHPHLPANRPGAYHNSMRHYEKLPALPTPMYRQPRPGNPAEQSQNFGDRVARHTTRFLVRDLKSVLAKDMERKMVENSVIKSFDEWWAAKQWQPVPAPTASPATPTPDVKPSENFMETPKSIEAEASKPISSALNELFGVTEGGLGGLPGFGLKAAIPKLPSFKRKVPEKEDEDDKSESAMSLDSNDEEEEREEKEEKPKEKSPLVSPSPAPSASTKISEDISDVSSDESTSDDDEEKETGSAGISADAESRDANKEDDEPASRVASEHSSEKPSVDSEIKDDELSASSSSESDDDDEDDASSEETESEESADDLAASSPAPKTSELAVEAAETHPAQAGPTGATNGAEKLEEVIENVEAIADASLTEKPVDEMEGLMVLDGIYIPYLYDHRYGKDPQTAPEPPTPPPPAPVVTAKAIEEKPILPLPSRQVGRPRKALTKKEDKVRQPTKPPKKFPVRTKEADLDMLLRFYYQGMDEEDIKFMKKTYDEEEPSWRKEGNFPNWIPHPVTAVNRDAFLPHSTGSARTEGVYRMNEKEKRQTFMRRVTSSRDRTALQSQRDISAARQQAQIGREARKVQRRLATSLGPDIESELLKANQLKFRKKLIRFGRSHIHGWGLFALENILPDEMIVEYVGQKIRLSVAERREVLYSRRGIGSSYLFRIDADQVIDATKTGNMARFINHSCSPNCYAKIITVEGDKRIVIYSKETIKMGEEITYDYKFPLEDEKIPCLCSAPNCRGSLN